MHFGGAGLSPSIKGVGNYLSLSVQIKGKDSLFNLLRSVSPARFGPRSSVSRTFLPKWQRIPPLKIRFKQTEMATLPKKIMSTTWN